MDLPTSEVDAAFKAVTDAREERLTKINNAQKYKNEKINEVKGGERDAILSQAEATKVSLIEKAKGGDTARFNAMLSEYNNNQEITRQRLIIHTIENVLKDTKVYVVDESSNTIRYLPIEFLGGEEE